jgi:UDP-glucose 4-epimerase
MDLAGKSFAVIGGAGFIGSHIVDQLLAADAAQVTVLDDLRRGRRANLRKAQDSRLMLVQESITDRHVVSKIVDGVDGVFLLAALWLDECARDPRAAWEVNVLGTWNVVEACRAAGGPRIVFSSSASVYGDGLTIPMTEDHPLGNRTVYGATKIAGEQMLHSAAAEWGQAYAGLRYMNVYGPRMDRLGAYVSVIVRTLDELTAGRPPIIHGDGNQTFDFVYVDDVARANILAMEAACSDELFNIGSGTGTTIRELSRLLCDLMGVAFEPRYEPAPRPVITQRIGSTEKARSSLGFESRVPLATGLRAVIEWWRREVVPEAAGSR